MPGLLDRWRRGREARRAVAALERAIEVAEAGGVDAPPRGVLADLAALRADGAPDDPHLDLLEARALFLAGRAAEAQAPAHRAATARPYDVESRITHGRICLALDRLDEAAHEFEAVLEEFGGDSDAENGRRAVALARGRAPLDEHPLPGDLDAAARLLVTCWGRAGPTQARLAALRARTADPHVLAALDAAGG
jgi:predicted Zn-dependent protease